MSLNHNLKALAFSHIALNKNDLNDINCLQLLTSLQTFMV